MKILIAPDKFKGSLSAEEVCELIAYALRQLDPSCGLDSIPLADGGEGTAKLLTEQTHGQWISCEASDPLFRKIQCGYGISGDGTTAFIEMAAASGLSLLSTDERNPLKTTSLGTGELIADALNHNVRKVVLAIGGSATHDAGIGMAAALGAKFFDSQQRLLKPIGESLHQIHSINLSKLQARLQSISFTVLGDVNNPLVGPNGAAYVFAPQKGADAKSVELLDQGSRNFESVIKRELNLSVNFPGAGAAGGLGAGAKAFLQTTLIPGIDYVLEAFQVANRIQQADLVITGEGKLDAQTLSGKVVKGVVQLAHQLGKPVVAVVGKNELNASELTSLGISKIISLVGPTTSSTEAMSHARSLLVQRIRDELHLDDF